LKKLILGLTLSFGILMLGACSNSDSDEVIVSTAEGDVTKEEFYQEMKSKSGPQVLEQMVYIEILEDKYEVSDKEVDERVEQFNSQFQNDMQKQQALQQNGIQNEEQLREALKQSLLFQKAQSAGVEVTEDELKKYYEENQWQFAEAETSHILLKDEETAKEVKQKLKDGADFTKLAKEYSKDPSVKENDGKLGTLKMGDQYLPQFLKAALQLEAGEVSDPVQTQAGFHIIKVTDKNVKPFEDVKEQVTETVKQQKAKPIKEVIANLKKESDIKVNDDQFKDLFKVQEQPKSDKSKTE
jgi:foldase protein PrsA